MSDQLNLSALTKHYADEAEAYKLIESIRWPDGPICPHCGSINNAYYLEPQEGTRKTRTGKETFRRVWKCADCRKQFSVLVGTIFEDSRIPLSKWLLGIHLMCSGKNGVSAHELHRTLEIAYRSAWFMAHRIRYAMERQPLAGMLSGVVEADETYTGGKAKGKRRRGETDKPRRSESVSLAPLTFEEALRGLSATESLPKKGKEAEQDDCRDETEEE